MRLAAVSTRFTSEYDQLPVEPLRRSSQKVEGLVCRDPVALHEDAFGLTDHVPALDGLTELLLHLRTAQRHRTEIRAYTGFRECSVLDAETLTLWLGLRGLATSPALC